MVTTRGRDSQGASRGAILASYVPRLVEDVQRGGSSDGLLIFDGTLVSADISGFTALSERLAGLGHEGAEELTDLLNRCFGQMIEACEERGGDIVKFGGDALLVLFTDDDHARRSVAAMERMRSIVAQGWSTNSVRHVRLGISQGAHSGLFGFSLVDGGHLELLVGGPAVSRTVDFEAAADRGQILLSPTTASLVPDGWLGRPSADGARPLRRGIAEVGSVGLRPLEARRGIDGLDRYLATPLIEQVLSNADGEHRQVAIAFVNAGGTDDLYFAEGPEALHEACQAVADNVREVLRAHPVHLLASDAYSNGTKMILTAGAPVSTDADDDHLLLALHDLFSRPSPLPLRAGANRGHVYVGDLGSTTRRTFTVMGDAVNLAARLMQKARPGEIVVSASILERARTTFHAAPLEPFLVKGKSKPIAAALLGDPIGHRRDDGESPEQTGIVEFVGRAAELESIDHLACGALEGLGAVVEITGEAGIGKSRLVREALTRRPELTRHAFRGGQYAKNSPYFVIRVFLRELIAVAESDDPRTVGARLRSWVGSNAPELTSWLPLLAIAVGAEVDTTPEVDRLGEEFRRERLLAVVADAIDVALGDRVALIAEDVHLFDSASQDVIARLARRAADRAWLVVLVHRGELDLGLESARRRETIDLEALTADDARRLAEVATRIAGSTDHVADARQIERLADRAGGHPLYLLELLSAGLDSEHDEALPESIESLVTTRIDKLPAQDRVLLREASVAGLVIDTTLIAESFDRPDLVAPDRWHALGDFLEHRGGDRFRFRHDLYRAVAYEGLAYRRRRHVHRALGHTLERRHEGDLARVAPLLSTHFDRGRDDDRAWTYSVLAADTSRAGYANDEAVMLYRRALDHAGSAAPAEPEEVARVAEALADVYVLSARYSPAVEAYQHSRRANRASIARRGADAPQDRLGARTRGPPLPRVAVVFAGESSAHRRSRRRRAPPRGGRDQRWPAPAPSTGRAAIGMSANFAGLAAAAAEAGHDRLALARAYNILWVAQTSLGVADVRDLGAQGSGDVPGQRRPRRRGERPEQPRGRGVLRRATGAARWSTTRSAGISAGRPATSRERRWRRTIWPRCCRCRDGTRRRPSCSASRSGRGRRPATRCSSRSPWPIWPSCERGPANRAPGSPRSGRHDSSRSSSARRRCVWRWTCAASSACSSIASSNVRSPKRCRCATSSTHITKATTS